MEYEAYCDTIREKLVERIRIAVEYDKLDSHEDPTVVFDLFEKKDQLSQLGPTIEALRTISQGANAAALALVMKKIDEIEKALHTFSDLLARNLQLGPIDLDSIPDFHFDKLARLFEVKYKSRLAIVSPSYWI